MSAKFFTTLILTGISFAARADETLAVLKIGSETYSNVTITSVSTTDVYFIYTGGMANVKIKNLSPDLQKHFNFNPQKAKETELKQAENQASYHDQIMREPVVHPPDMTREQPIAAVNSPEPLWRNDLSGALQQAQSENKRVLLDFTGSDWCPWCIKFDQEVLSTEKFAAYAGQNLELVKVDFPHHTPQSADLRQANEALAKQFQVDSYPTYVLLDSVGRELGRQNGYVEGGPDAFISKLDGFSKQ
jgi:thiol-disulfide isomerase/thioredoxin